MGLMQALGGGPIALDTSIFIYFIERNPVWVDRVRSVFSEAVPAGVTLVTSELTLLEVLVMPKRIGDLALAERYEALLTRSRGLSLVSVDRHHLRAAAQLRAVYRIRTPDAIQLSAALSSRCTAFVTNDRRVPKIQGINVVQLSELG